MAAMMSVHSNNRSAQGGCHGAGRSIRRQRAASASAAEPQSYRRLRRQLSTYTVGGAASFREISPKQKQRRGRGRAADDGDAHAGSAASACSATSLPFAADSAHSGFFAHRPLPSPRGAVSDSAKYTCNGARPGYAQSFPSQSAGALTFTPGAACEERVSGGAVVTIVGGDTERAVVGGGGHASTDGMMVANALGFLTSVHPAALMAGRRGMGNVVGAMGSPTTHTAAAQQHTPSSSYYGAADTARALPSPNPLLLAPSFPSVPASVPRPTVEVPAAAPPRYADSLADSSSGVRAFSAGLAEDSSESSSRLLFAGGAASSSCATGPCAISRLRRRLEGGQLAPPPPPPPSSGAFFGVSFHSPNNAHAHAQPSAQHSGPPPHVAVAVAYSSHSRPHPMLQFPQGAALPRLQQVRSPEGTLLTDGAARQPSDGPLALDVAVASPNVVTIASPRIGGFIDGAAGERVGSAVEPEAQCFASGEAFGAVPSETALSSVCTSESGRDEAGEGINEPLMTVAAHSLGGLALPGVLSTSSVCDGPLPSSISHASPHRAEGAGLLVGMRVQVPVVLGSSATTSCSHYEGGTPLSYDESAGSSGAVHASMYGAGQPPLSLFTGVVPSVHDSAPRQRQSGPLGSDGGAPAPHPLLAAAVVASPTRR